MKKFIFLIIFFIWAIPFLSEAAVLRFEAAVPSINIGQPVQVRIYADSAQEKVNAFSVSFEYPKNLKLTALRDGNSVISIWIARPENSGNVVSFDGIIPGGYEGGSGLLLTADFEAIEEGQGNFYFLDTTKVLLHDGQGSTAQTTFSMLPFYVGPKDQAVPVPGIPEDRDPPESFIPEFVRNELIAGGKLAVIFNAQDKRSGIDHFEIKEVWQYFPFVETKWEKADSPYVVGDQKGTSRVFIKAVDKSGNERIAVAEPPVVLSFYAKYAGLIIMVIVILVLLVYAVLLLIKRRSA